MACVAKICGKLFSVGMFNDEYRPKKYYVENIALEQSSRNDTCVNLAEIMALFASEWIIEQKRKNTATTADDFEEAIKKFAKEYQNEKLYDWYGEKVLELRHFFPLPDSGCSCAPVGCHWPRTLFRRGR